MTAHAIGVVPYSSGAGFGSDSFLIKHGDWVSPTASPDTAAQALLQGISGPATPTTPAVDESVFRQALSLTEKELESLQKAVSGLSSEQSKLQVHLDAVRKLKTTAMNPSVSMSTSCMTKPSLPAVDAARGLKPLDQTNFGKLLDTQLEASATAIL